VRLNNEDGSPTCGAQLIFNELRLRLDYDKGLAEFVEIVRRWDTWEWKKLKDNTPMHFNLVFRTIGIEDFVKDYLNYFETLDMYNEALKELPEDSRISKVSVEFDMTQEHKLILKYKLHEMERYIYDKLPQVRIFEDEFKNSVAFVVADSHISELCDSVLDNKLCDYVCCFTGDTMSLRSREGFDVSAIAKHYGGGGRECTAGMPPIPYYIEKYVTILLYEV
jgi:oligoribonuclease NrnB/cAMP/cGMP phosphodiesterase (DHH superfamily)